MQKYIFNSIVFLFILLTTILRGNHIVYVHLGNTIPPYAYTAFEQARLFNQDATIILIANKRALDQSSYNFDTHHITTVACETLPQSTWHTYFKRHTPLNPRTRDGFWRKAMERFFYLHEYISTYNLTHVIHMEYDNMLYADIAEMQQALSQYTGIGIVLDCDYRCIPSFVYIANQQAIEQLVQFIAQHAHKKYNDMKVLALYYNTSLREYVDTLPFIMPEYLMEHALINKKNERTITPQKYWNNIEFFNSIFDGAALGQYLGGIDPRNGVSKPGFINETCLFNPSYLIIEWRLDKKGRNVPFAICGGKAYRINNLHIHSKNLESFKS